jgi:hypothetical protein
MPWNPIFPLGTVSVKANQAIGNQNTTYIEDTMGKSPIGTNTNTTRDHFWAVGSNEDGRHRFINSVGFTVGGLPTDPVIGAGMDIVLYSKTTNNRVEWFTRNAQGIYQFSPSFIEGTVNINNSFVNVVSVPANVYGEIFFFFDSNPKISSSGIISSNANSVSGYSTRQRSSVSGLDEYPIELQNASTTTLNIRAKRGDNSGSGFDGLWRYKLFYRSF